MFVLVAASGLVVTAQVTPIANDYGIAEHAVWLLFITVDRADRRRHRRQYPQRRGAADLRLGLRPYRPREHDGDRLHLRRRAPIGRSGTIGTSPVGFILTAGLVYFTWGEIYSLFPATCTDSYGVEIRHDQCRAALHRQGHGLLPRAVGQSCCKPRPAAGMRSSWSRPSPISWSRRWRCSC